MRPQLHSSFFYMQLIGPCLYYMCMSSLKISSKVLSCFLTYLRQVVFFMVVQNLTRFLYSTKRILKCSIEIVLIGDLPSCDKSVLSVHTFICRVFHVDETSFIKHIRQLLQYSCIIVCLPYFPKATGLKTLIRQIKICWMCQNVVHVM